MFAQHLGRSITHGEDSLHQFSEEFCAHILGLPSVPQRAPGTRGRATSNRRVDGSAIRRALGITLAYPSYRTGIPASLVISAR